MTPVTPIAARTSVRRAALAGPACSSPPAPRAPSMQRDAHVVIGSRGLTPYNWLVRRGSGPGAREAERQTEADETHAMTHDQAYHIARGRARAIRIPISCWRWLVA